MATTSITISPSKPTITPRRSQVNRQSEGTLGLIASPLKPAGGELLGLGSFNLTRGPWRVGESPSPGITNRSQNLRWIQHTVGGYVTTTDLVQRVLAAQIKDGRELLLDPAKIG